MISGGIDIERQGRGVQEVHREISGALPPGRYIPVAGQIHVRTRPGASLLTMFLY